MVQKQKGGQWLLEKKTIKQWLLKKKRAISTIHSRTDNGFFNECHLYSCFQTWQIACNLIFNSELCDLPKPQKVNTVLCWSGDFSIQQLKSWQKDAIKLTLEFLWKEFEAYCKPQSNELCAHYDQLKKLNQRNLPCDETGKPVTSVQLLCRDWKGSSSWSISIWARGWILHEQNHQENPEITTAQL